jgi:crotonobetainyl-CoA:carnitine CoA-transferase CaiB-like acyl-CoA transferase
MLKNLKVLDFSSVLAGPAVATFFAELGAQVIKVENKQAGGDVTRQWKLSAENPDSTVSAYFSSVNYGKEYLFLDVFNEVEKQQVFDLAATSDIFITNYRTSSLKKMGLDFETLHAISPKLIYAAITGFESEPGRAAYDVVLQAETGYMAMNGTPETAPVKLPLAFIDILAAHQLKEAILLSLYKRIESGKGMHVSVSLEAAAIASLANQAGNWLMAGFNPQPIGSLHPNIAPYGETFETSDHKKIVLAVGSDEQFKKLCTILGNSSLSKDIDFTTNPQRVINRKKLQHELQKLFSQFRQKELMQQFIAQNVPAGAVKDISEVFETDFAQSMVLDEVIDNTATKRVKSVAFTFQ